MRTFDPRMNHLVMTFDPRMNHLVMTFDHRMNHPVMTFDPVITPNSGSQTGSVQDSRNLLSSRPAGLHRF